MRLLLVPLFFASFASASLLVENPRCEGMRDPSGVETNEPRFSWTLVETDATVRGQDSQAFELRVADSVSALQEGKNLIWKTAATGRSVSAVYQGAPLSAGIPYFWQVRAKGKDGTFSPWSVPSRFQLAIRDWENARWIGETSSFFPAWSDGRISVRFTLKENALGIYFRTIDAENGYQWQLNTGLFATPHLRPHLCRNGKWTVLSNVDLGPYFSNPIDMTKPHTMDIETKGSVIRTFLDGVLVDERQDATFRSGTVGFRTTNGQSAEIDRMTVKDAKGHTLLDESFNRADACMFRNVSVKNGKLLLTNKTVLYYPNLPKNCPRFRKTFSLQNKPVRHACASVSGLGFYELYVNGAKAGTGVTAPANTAYLRRVYFDTLDVAPLLAQGKENTVGLWLAPGYSDDYSRWGWKWEQPKRGIVHLRITYTDGTVQTVVTDSSWQTTSLSPLSYASLYDGEIYDAANEDAAWCTPQGTASGWGPVRVLPPVKGLTPSIGPAVRVVETVHPVRITEPKPNVYVADMGQNRAGWTRIRAKGPKGTKIVLRHSELIDKDGMIAPWTNRRAKATDTFILAGTGDWETYEPRFTYHGFRFVEITGYPGRPERENITGCAVHADIERSGTFRCSHEGLNWLYRAALWSMLSNLQGIPTDCAMRDERTPCQMDSQTYEDTALLTFWMQRYYAKWVADIRGGSGNPDWSGDQVVLPWRLYQVYGDLRILEDNYACMAHLTDSVYRRFPDGLCKDGFGDWCPPNDGTWAGYHGDVELVNTALYAEMLRIMRCAAELLGKEEDVQKFAKILENVKTALNTRLYQADTKTYGDGSQTTAVLPLAFGLVPEAERSAVFARLVQTIREKNKSRVDTGIYGTRYLGDVLCENGQADLAVRLMTQPEYPGFGYMFARGATTFWEQWTFRGGMNSHNHAMFSGGAAFLYTHLAGIRPEAAGYATVGIHPVFPESLRFVEAECVTARGRCRSAWRREGSGIAVDMVIPVTADGICSFPAPDADHVTENGKPFAQSSGVHFLGKQGGRVRFALPSGIYKLLLRP